MSKKLNKFLYISVFILSITYILSFTRSCTGKNKREVIKTALVNPKYKTEINKFLIFKEDEQIHIQKNDDDKWVIKDYKLGIAIPASSEKIEKLINNLTNITNMYKLSDKLSKNSSFGLMDSSACHIRYYFPDSFHELIFGNQDFTLSSRYLMTDKNTVIYEISDYLDPFLSTSVQSWTDPFLISQEILNKIKPEDVQNTTVLFNSEKHMSQLSDIEKFLDLRHGGLPAAENMNSISNISDITIELKLGNKNEVKCEIFSTDDESVFIVKNAYFDSKSNKTQIFVSKISLWTYNKIKEITL